MCFRGGGNRGEARDIVRKIELAAKQLGSGATHVALCNKIGPYFRHWCKFLKVVRAIRRKDDKSETEAICRHSERLAKESSLLQYKAVAKNENNSSETDHASMPLDIFASKSVSHKTNVGGVGTPPYVAKLVSCRHSVLKLLLAQNCHSYCCRRYELCSSLPELATRPQFRNADLHKKSAFTLAEVLITLGIIGVVAALTLPTVIQNYKEKELITRTKKVFSSIQNASILGQQDSNSIGDNGSLFNREDGYLKVTENFAKYFDGAKVCKRYSDCRKYYYTIKYSDYLYTSSGQDSVGDNSYQPRIILKDSSVLYLAELIPNCDNVSVDVTYDSNGRPTSFVNHREYCALITFDVNGVKSPNQYGIDAFMAVIYKDKVSPGHWNKAGGETLTNILSGKEKLHAKRIQN